MSILDQIFDHKRLEVTDRRIKRPLALVRREAENAALPRDFISALRQLPAPALIAEIKHASPSRGLLRADFDPLRLAEMYQANGARAVSILTDERYFRGSLDDLRQVRSRFSTLPLLQKDFIFDPYQLYEARACGADAMLLIAAGIDLPCLADLYRLATELAMSSLIEVHSLAELERILPLEPALIGINNRDLHTFSVDVATTLAILPHVPTAITVVSESGIHSHAQAEELVRAGVYALLVGEAIITSPDPAAKVRELSAPIELPVAASSGITVDRYGV